MAITLTYISSTSTTAIFNYSVSGYSLPSTVTKRDWTGDEPTSGTTWSQTMVETLYLNLSYVWSFGKTTLSGTHIFTELYEGRSNAVSGSVTVKCQQRDVAYTRTRTRTLNGDAYGPWGDWRLPTISAGDWSNYTIGTEGPISRTVYTKPSIFIWSGTLVSGETIEFNLSASDWNLLCDKARLRLNWLNLNDNANTDSAVVLSGEIISAYKYNLLAGYLGINGVTVGDLIKPSLFTALSDAVNV